MAADQERAERIRALKQERPDLTWRRIADYVGVTERSATDWQKKGGIDYDNAKKLAELFEVDTDYIWRGPAADERAPSPFAGADDVQDQLDALNAKLDRILSLIGGLDKHWTGVGEEIADRLDALEQHLTGHVDDSAERLDAAVKDAVAKLAAAPAPRPAPKRKTAPKRTQAASKLSPA